LPQIQDPPPQISKEAVVSNVSGIGKRRTKDLSFPDNPTCVEGAKRVPPI